MRSNINRKMPIPLPEPTSFLYAASTEGEKIPRIPQRPSAFPVSQSRRDRQRSQTRLDIASLEDQVITSNQLTGPEQTRVEKRSPNARLKPAPRSQSGMFIAGLDRYERQSVSRTAVGNHFPSTPGFC